jgi:hypothetical protein
MSVETIRSDCEIINKQEERNDQLIILCDWAEQSMSLYGGFAQISYNNPVILEMVFGGLIGTLIRRYYSNYLKKKLLKVI